MATRYSRGDQVVHQPSGNRATVRSVRNRNSNSPDYLIEFLSSKNRTKVKASDLRLYENTESSNKTFKTYTEKTEQGTREVEFPTSGTRFIDEDGDTLIVGGVEALSSPTMPAYVRMEYPNSDKEDLYLNHSEFSRMNGVQFNIDKRHLG